MTTVAVTSGFVEAPTSSARPTSVPGPTKRGWRRPNPAVRGITEHFLPEPGVYPFD